MEGSGAGIGRLDCYEDMFKEITRKLYGDDPDHRTSSVQNEFETSVSYKNEDDTEHGTDGSDDGNWTCEDEPLKGTDGSRIAAYHAGKTTWRCYECGDCMGGAPRDVAEHFVELHSSRIISDDTRSRQQQQHHPHHHHHHHNNSPRKDYLQNELKVEEIVTYLERLRDRAERSAPPSRRTQETQTIPAALLPVATTFLIQELPTVSSPTGQQHLHQQSLTSSMMLTTTTTTSSSSSTTTTPTTTTTTTTSTNSGNGNTSSSGKRYTCPNCPYGTDRRDLYTRHENIHREEKPFHCYVCYKPFNRADHVKKHFLRMHREHTYELSRIRRNGGTTSSRNVGATIASNTTTATTTVAPTTSVKTLQTLTNNVTSQNVNGNAIQLTGYTTNFNNNKSYQMQTVQQANNGGNVGSIYQTTAATLPLQGIVQNEVSCATVNNRRMQNGGCNSKSHVKGGTKGAQERRYTCCYCSWSGVDNWCLKRHLNTHLKPFACALCEYKAARAERLATHVLKVHNKRQCSRCSFLGEDAAQLQVHQLHVHRVSSASAPASTNQQTANANNRHQQPVHPAVGGRPPPGPPVFPASSPSIPTATSVIPSTTILGKIGLGESKIALRYNDWFVGARPLCASNVARQSNGATVVVADGCSRRSRKQSTPRKVLIDNCEINENEKLLEKTTLSTTTTTLTTTKNSPSKCTRSDKETCENDNKNTKDCLKCYQCPDDATSRGTATRPYLTRAALALHTLWRHRRCLRRSTRNSSSYEISRQQQQQQQPNVTELPKTAITVKATVITTNSSNYRYQR